MKTIRYLLTIALLLSGLTWLVPGAGAQGEMDIVEIAAGDGRFATLVAAVEAAGLTEALQGEGPLTVFAPTDEAFAKLPEGTVEGLLNDIPTLRDILLYHVVEGEVMAADVVQLESAETLLGEPVAITVVGDTVRINESRVLITDIQASNGVIHVIDSVLLPPPEAGENEYVVARGDTLFGIAERLLGNGRRYMEIVEATNARNAEDPSFAFIEDPNRILIGWKLALPTGATETAAESEAMADEQDIVAIAVADGRFETLVAAVQAAGLVDELQGEGPFTVFAPTDEAFAALPEGTLESLLAEPEGQLTQILLYHVLSGEVMAAQVTDGLTAETLQGGELTFSVENGNVMVNDANIILTDIEASNGVIHVIDAVLLPES